MRKLTAIWFLLLLLFNLAGYRLWFYHVQSKSDAQLTAALDKEEYNAHDLLELRVPLALPYQTEWKEFERVDGEIQIDGKTYKYVKRKVVNGEMVLLCLPDHNRTKIESAREQFFQLANSLQSDAGEKQNSSKALSLKNILSEYDDEQRQWMLQTPTNKRIYIMPLNETLLSLFDELVPGQPPDFLFA